MANNIRNYHHYSVRICVRKDTWEGWCINTRVYITLLWPEGRQYYRFFTTWLIKLKKPATVVVVVVVVGFFVPVGL